jgi:hemerythrin-like domain-containing protein
VKALGIIRAEHRSLAAVLYTLQAQMRGACEGRFAPDYPLAREIIDYLESFHQRFHHPKEDDFLFKALRERSAAANAELERLEGEHAEGDTRLAALREAIDRAQSGAGSVQEFAAEIERYADFHWRHMRAEEDVVMPLAERLLSLDDWRRIDAAFEDNEDPLFGKAKREEYRRLLAAIAEHAPAPFGAGDKHA